MSYKDLQTTAIDLEYGQDPNEFWKYLFIIIAMVGYIYYIFYIVITKLWKYII